MRQQGRRLAAMSGLVSPELQQRLEDALRSQPDDNPIALAAWNRKYGGLLTEYQQAVAQAKEKKRKQEVERTKRRLRIAAAIIGILLVAGAIIHWATRPSADELRQEEKAQKDAACTTHYEKTLHLQLVGKQIDWLKDGEGGWVDLHPYSEAPTVGGLDLSPSELLAGKIGKAQVNHEGYVYDSALGIGNWALLERSGGHLVLTLFSYPFGYGDLPHAPLQQANTASAVIVRGEMLSTMCE